MTNVKLQRKADDDVGEGWMAHDTCKGTGQDKSVLQM
jgi:hypothetical protein